WKVDEVVIKAKWSRTLEGHFAPGQVEIEEEDRVIRDVPYGGQLLHALVKREVRHPASQTTHVAHRPETGTPQFGRAPAKGPFHRVDGFVVLLHHSRDPSGHGPRSPADAVTPRCR